MVRTQVQFTQEQMERLRGLAEEEGESVAALVRRGVDMLLATQRELSDAEMRRRALAAAGRFASGCDDLGEDHDQHLERSVGA